MSTIMPLLGPLLKRNTGGNEFKNFQMLPTYLMLSFATKYPLEYCWTAPEVHSTKKRGAKVQGKVVMVLTSQVILKTNYSLKSSGFYSKTYHYSVSPSHSH